ncbi:MAG: glycosyltransferase [Halomonas sp.]|nr:glycosyltransferase family 4 protein [Halomonas sp.]TVP50151.1 MAG: glycosyltransferase [Halomonas sp.]
MKNTDLKEEKKPNIHIFNSFRTEFGGSEQEALNLAAILAEQAEVTLWASSSRACPALMSKNNIKHIDVSKKDKRPNGGTYIFVGCHWRNKLWPYLIARPSRLINIYNTFHPKHIKLTKNPPSLLRWPTTEYVLISHFQQKELNIAAQIFPSPINLNYFNPEKKEPASSRQIHVGRMSRDTLEKHSLEDIDVYQWLANLNVKVMLQGADCLKGKIEPQQNIMLLQSGAIEAKSFLNGLDIFYYRSGAHVETFGRVIFEAMACGVPVVAENRGGYTDWIKSGENGFLFDTTQEAIGYLERLISDDELREKIAAQGLKTVNEMYGDRAKAAQISYYLYE